MILEDFTEHSNLNTMLLPEVRKEYFGVYPTVLFACHGYAEPMHFVMLLKNCTFEDKKDLILTMLHCGASISFDLKEATDHSIVLVNHEEIIDFPGPVFYLNYIKACIDACCLLDINQFKQEATKDIASGCDCMSVVYFKSETWTSLLNPSDDETWDSMDCYENHYHGPRHDSFEIDPQRDPLNSFDNLSHDPFQSEGLRIRTMMSSTPIDAEALVNANSCEEIEGYSTCSSDTDIEKSIPEPHYNSHDSETEDTVVKIDKSKKKDDASRIEQHVEKVSTTSECLKSSAASKKSCETRKGVIIEDEAYNTSSSDSDMEETFTVDSSSTNNIKNRAVDMAVGVDKEKGNRKNTNTKKAEVCSSVEPEKSPSKWLKSAASKKRCETRKRQVTDSSDSDVEVLSLSDMSLDTNSIDSSSTNNGKTSRNTAVDMAVCVDKEKSGIKNINRGAACGSKGSKKTPSKWPFLDEFASSDEENVLASPVKSDVIEDKGEKVCQSKDKREFLKDIISDQEEETSSKSSKRSRQPYSIEERINILKYIVDQNEFLRVKGREMWIIMERKKVCPSRTWQSMKEHFLKRIVVDLEPYPFLKNEDKRKLMNAYS